MTATPRTGPLAGIRVVDISTVMAGPFATHLLADQGADVVKIEPLDGDIMRHSGPAPAPGMSPIFQHMNRGKRSLALDLKQPAGRDVLLRLVRDADVFLYNMRPQAMVRLGLAYDVLRADNPGLVYCGIVGFGQGGPYAARPAYDDLIQGISGIPDLVARANGTEPRYVPFALCDRIAGLYAVNALLAALVARGRSGTGAAIEVPMFEASVHFLLVEHLFGASFVPEVGTGAFNARMLEPNRKPYRTRDGYVCVLPYTTRHWVDVFALMGRPELASDPRFADFAARRQHIDVLYDLLATLLATRTTQAWLTEFEQRDIPAVRANSVPDLLADPHLAATGFFQPHDEPTGRFVHMQPPVRWASQRAHEARPAPVLGQHSEDVLHEAGYDDAAIAALAQANVIALPRSP